MVTRDQIKQVKELVEMGMSYREAGKKVGLSSSQAYYHTRVKAGKGTKTKKARVSRKKAAPRTHTQKLVKAIMDLDVSVDIKVTLLSAMVGK